MSDVTIDATDVHSALGTDPDAPNAADYTFEIEQASVLVAEEIAPYATDASADRLSMVGALLAAAFADDDGSGPIRSVGTGPSRVQFAPENDRALTYWKRALQMDPSGRLADLGKQTASLSVPDLR